MALGGNAPWKEFFNNHPSNTLLGRDFESCTIAERYDSEAGEEWKERLTAKVEEREYVPGARPAAVKKVAATPAMSGSGRSTPQGGSAPQRIASPSQKERNEAYFASKGQENENRPEGVAPSQGGKYAGFGSSPMPTSSNDTGVPSASDFQADPVAALTRGFGWLSSTVTKQAATVNKQYIQPGLSNLAQADLAAQARATAAQLGSTVQQGTRGLGDQFQRFVDPDSAPGNSGGISRGGGQPQPAKKDFWDSFGEAPTGPPREKKDFWDDFAAVGEQVVQKKGAGSSSIGTSAMKSGGKKEEEDGWGKW